MDKLRVVEHTLSGRGLESRLEQGPDGRFLVRLVNDFGIPTFFDEGGQPGDSMRVGSLGWDNCCKYRAGWIKASYQNCNLGFILGVAEKAVICGE